ncbi:MAG: hypothetical protein UZ12_BCD005000121 [Bacteroidetes bacterium OLB12]|nr:MAG: hypothetical protein UZ12_BCD005000121 [Bacteroidetes bacterium OLB12]
MLSGLVACKKDSDPTTFIPTLETLSGNWVSTDTVDMEPSIRNFRAQALTNKDLTSISWFASAPYAGGYHTGTMRVNGTTPLLTHFRWQPFQALRKSISENMEINSATRMVVDQNVILWEVEIKNLNKSKTDFTVEIDHIGFISKYDSQEWQWWYPYPTLAGQVTKRDDVIENMRDHIGTHVTSIDQEVEELVNGRPTKTLKRAVWPSDAEVLNSEKYSCEQNANLLLISDSETAAITGFNILTSPDAIEKHHAGGTSSWKFSLAQNETKVIRFALAWGDDASQINASLREVEKSFDVVWASIESEWERRWYEIFKPDNQILSGTFPILETSDAVASKVYYTGPLTMLYLMNTNLPQHKKSILNRWAQVGCVYYVLLGYYRMGYPLGCGRS